MSNRESSDILKLNTGALALSVSHVNEYCDIGRMSFDPAHIHTDFEIYINVSGDVSFMHGQSVFRMERGDVVLSYPGDVHYCIYHSSCVHEHFCIRFSCDGDGEVAKLLRNNDFSGFIRHTVSVKERIIEISDSISKNEGSFDVLCDFLSLLSVLKKRDSVVSESESIPKRVTEILSYIDENLTSIKTTDDISRAFFISKPTLDRLFRKHVHISVHKFLEAKRLSLSESLLKGGATVTEACYGAGFSDCSRFIEKFKEKFGMTPLKYKTVK